MEGCGDTGIRSGPEGPWSPGPRLLPPGRAVPRRREVAAAAERGAGLRGGGAMPAGGCPRGTSPAVGSAGIPAALRLCLRFNPFPGRGAALGGSCGGERGCPPPSPPGKGGAAHAGGVRTRVGSGCARFLGSCPPPRQLLCMPGSAQPCWHGALPRNTCRSSGCKQSFSLLTAAAGLPGAPRVSPHPLLLLSGAAGLFTLRPPLCTLLERSWRSPRSWGTRGTRERGWPGPHPAAGGCRFGHAWPWAVTRAPVPPQRGVPSTAGGVHRVFAPQDVACSQPAFAPGADGCIYRLGGYPAVLAKCPKGPGAACSSDTCQTRLGGCGWSAWVGHGSVGWAALACDGGEP